MSAPLDETYGIEPLAGHHDRAAFACGVEALDRYLRQQAGQDARKRVASVYLALHRPTAAVAGFYTLSNAGIALSQLPAALAKSLPKYPAIPVTLLGRLAVAESHRGVGLGEHLLLDALARSLESSRAIASFAVLVEAKDESARAFYTKYGALSLPEEPPRLLWTMETVQRLFSEASQP